MQAPPAFGFEQLIPELLRGLADPVADRPGQTEAQRFARHQTAIFAVMAFLPRDATETMLASHCVIYDHVLRDAARDLLRDETEAGKRRSRSQLIASGRLFLTSLARLDQYQARPGQQSAAPCAPREAPTAATPQPNDGIAASAGAEPATADTEQDSSQPLSTGNLPAAAEPPPQAASAGMTELQLPHSFQNRRMRRALQFKKPVSKSAKVRSAQLAAAR